MKKLFSLTLFLLLLLATPISTIYAQEASTDTPIETQVDEKTTRATNRYFDLTLTEGLQSPLDKSITYTLVIVPHIDSSKTQILWDSSSTIKITPKHAEFVNLMQDQQYTYKATVKPTTSGTYNINATVIAWQYDTNYTNTVNNSITLSNGLVSLPVTPEYTLLVAIEILVFLGISGLAIWGGVTVSKKFTQKAKVWLTPPR